MLAIRYSNDADEGDLFYADGSLVFAGYDLETAVTLSLFLDAPAQDGDNVDEGTPRRGWWADVFSEDGSFTGSRLWTLENALPTPGNGQRAEAYARDALQWLVDGRYVRKVEVSHELGEEAILLKIDVFLRDGKVVPLGPFEVS